jgi:hypothetical protein
MNPFNDIIIFLPIDIINIIKEYTNKKYLVFTNKKNYILYHPLIRYSIQKYDSYIRDTIIRDSSFVFERIIKENSERWLKTNDYIYKNIIFKKYIYFTMYYCIENKSPKCKNIIDKLFEELGLNKNQHKKNLVKYIIWKK